MKYVTCHEWRAMGCMPGFSKEQSHHRERCGTCPLLKCLCALCLVNKGMFWRLNSQKNIHQAEKTLTQSTAKSRYVNEQQEKWTECTFNYSEGGGGFIVVFQSSLVCSGELLV